jgi:hypothetical protein
LAQRRRNRIAALLALFAGVAALVLAALPRHWLESVMWRHMLLQLPLLLAAGWLIGIGLGAANPRCLRRLRTLRAADRHGLTGMTAALFITAYWMIPRALELSINLPQFEAAKFASLLLAGFLLPGALKRASMMIQLFFLGNFCWMTAIVGIQYQNMPQRLCNAYLLDDQLTTGAGLVMLSIAAAVIWCVRHAPVLLSSNEKPPTHATPGTEPPRHRHAGQ